MTTTNGDRGRVVEHVEGQVAAVNPRGVKLVGEPDYRNFSKYADPPITPPRRGQHVTLGLDTDGFVRTLEVAGADLATPAGDTDRSREIRRQVAIQTAAQVISAFAQTREDVKTDHLFPLADRILAWLEQPEREA